MNHLSIKNRLINLVIITITIFIPISSYSIESKMIGKVTLLRGKVYVVKASQTEKNLLKVGDSVFSSDQLESEVNSAARITMIDNNLIDIYPKSKILISKYIYDSEKNEKNVELKLDYGKVKSTVNQKYDDNKNKFQVQTPTVVAGVRGTIFTTGYDPIKKLSEVVTIKGLVAVEKFADKEFKRPPVLVKPDFKLEAQNISTPLEVKELPKIEIQKLDSEDKKLGIESDITQHEIQLKNSDQSRVEKNKIDSTEKTSEELIIKKQNELKNRIEDKTLKNVDEQATKKQAEIEKRIEENAAKKADQQAAKKTSRDRKTCRRSFN